MSLPVRPVRFEPSPCCPPPRFEEPLEPEIEERIEIGIRDEIDVPARSAVTAVRAAARNELLATEAHGAAAAVAGGNADVDFVYEHWKSVVVGRLSLVGRSSVLVSR